MRRLLAHPALRYLLLLPLCAWPMVVSLVTYEDEWGPLGFLGSAFTRQNHGFGCRWRTSDAVDFYLTPEGSLSLRARGSMHWEPENPDSDEVLVASLISKYPPTRGYGLVLQSVHHVRQDQYVEWVRPPESTGVSSQHLSDSFALHANLLMSESAPESVVVDLFDRGLYSAFAFRRGGPFEFRVRRFDTNWLYLATELSFLSLIAWWLLTLRYARGLWPRPDGTRCPSCGYPTQGLPSPTCPECGNPIRPLPVS